MHPGASYFSSKTNARLSNDLGIGFGVVSIQKLCDGLGITLRQFFDDDLFDNIAQEIK